MENNNLNQNTNKSSTPEKKIPVPPIPRVGSVAKTPPQGKTTPIQPSSKQPPTVANKPKNPPAPPLIEKAPELASLPNANDNTVLGQKGKPTTKKNISEQSQTVLDVGPAKKKINFNKARKIFGLVIFGLVILGIVYVGYLYFINLTPSEVPEEKIRRTREVNVQDAEVDPKSLDMLEKRFNDFGDQLEVMKNDTNFESEINLEKGVF